MGRFGRYLRRGTVVGIAGAGLFDATNDNVLSRSLRTVTAAARIAYAYKFTTPQSVEDLVALNKHAAQVLLDTCLANEGLYP